MIFLFFLVLRMGFKMKSIEVDSDVFSHLQKHARPFIDTTPNSILRRLLGIGSDDPSSKQTTTPPNAIPDLDSLYEEAIRTARSRSKAPKADLKVLLKSGLLKNGDKLCLVDYQGNKVKKFVAVILDADLIYDGQRYAMSNLAQKLLSEMGFKSKSVRGPAHWATSDGQSVRDLWQQHIDNDSKN